MTGCEGRGRRGRAQLRTPTEGLVYARTRHATSRAGDPEPHDHVLVANLVEMLDDRGGYKALDTALVRDVLHAATMVGRLAAARRAVELGFAILPDAGPSGKLGHWRIAGIPLRACEVLSKRSAEIDAAVAEAGHDTYRARQVAARTTRRAKRHTPEAESAAGVAPGARGGRVGGGSARPDGVGGRSGHGPARPPVEPGGRGAGRRRVGAGRAVGSAQGVHPG